MRAFHAAILAAGLFVATAAGAQALTPPPPAREPASERISLTHVDFRDQVQVEAVYRRLQRAAMFVCGVSSFADKAERAESRACAEKAVREAIDTLDKPLLTAAYRQSGAPLLASGY